MTHPPASPESISSLEDAKAYFQCMGCSGFHMFREDEELYRQYEALEISKDLEREWRLDSISRYLDLLERPDCESRERWTIYFHLATQIRESRSTRFLQRLVDATRHGSAKTSKFDRLLMAEAIVGDQSSPLDRKSIARLESLIGQPFQRPGLILFAFDAGLPELAAELSTLAGELASLPFTPEDEAELPMKDLQGTTESRRLNLLSELDVA
ncbi:MAG TPA: hypothetical protein VGE67_08025, partial [Haloferula sp.]